ncbi:hypothetical protein CDL15_Pgr011121 [Punica granatum]|uniref:non-specific serine/threonine protein kinase n=1 Tax=Punica granatum TaxID=22663 RepID=A0A218XMT2_PUNGR|nr:hypothetical protein CDL15_Pgr011121 [Punica granatum]PKI32698.1 hypothetical protein CRG98_046905 [Punica granatum]
MTKSSPSFLLLLALPILLARLSLCAVDPQFEACRVPTTCGHLNISYPFYIRGQQPPFCGFPGFDISCLQGQPVLNVSNAPYIIRGIDYKSQSLRVLLNWTESCEFPWLIDQNLTLPGNQFELKPDVRTLFLFYNCNASSEGADTDGLSRHRVNCSGLATSRNATLLGLYGDDPVMGNASRRCKLVVEVPVEVKSENVNNSTLEALIGGGFGMKWIASNCSICEDSGGRCGFDYTDYHFECFCPDRPHARHCVDPGTYYLRNESVSLSA